MKNSKRNLIFTIVIAGLAMMNGSVHASSISVSNAAPVAVAFTISSGSTQLQTGTIAIGASKTITLPAAKPTNTTGYSSITGVFTAPGYTSVTKTLNAGAGSSASTPAATVFKLQAVGNLLQFVD